MSDGSGLHPRRVVARRSAHRASVLARREPLPNPGRLEELKKEAQIVLSPDVFEGARFEFNKTLSQKFALLHNVTMAGGAAGAYEFGAHFGDERMLLASRIDMQGRLNGRLNAQLNDAVLLRLQAQVAPESLQQQNSFKADVDYKGGDFCMGGYFMGGGLLGASYLQSVSSGLAIGCEGFYHTLNKKVRGGAGGARRERLGCRDRGVGADAGVARWRARKVVRP